jgi:hypothetical protein
MRNSFIDKIMPAEPDRHIYWDVLNHETNTTQSFNVKLDALLYKKTLPHATVYFNWYENLFKQSTFFQEPSESLAELQRQRALEIRNKYSYVRLWLSGGADSITALNAFLDNDVHIDEIILFCRPDVSMSDISRSSNREILMSALPYLEFRKDKLVKTKINNLTLTKNDYKSVLGGPDKLGFIPYLESTDSGSFSYGLNSSQLVWQKVIAESKHENFCDVFGGTKATICNKDGNYYFYFVDTGLTDMVFGSRSEDFFISKTDPKLFIKTAHMLKKHAQMKQLSPAELIMFQSKSEYANRYNLALGRSLAYNSVAGTKHDRGNGLFSHKVKHVIVSYKHFLFVENMSVDEEWHKMFLTHHENLKIMKDKFDWMWNTDKYGIPEPQKGYKGHVSKLYSLDRYLIADSHEIYKDGFLR